MPQIKKGVRFDVMLQPGSLLRPGDVYTKNNESFVILGIDRVEVFDNGTAVVRFRGSKAAYQRQVDKHYR